MNLAKTMVFLGIILLVAGGLLWLAPKIPGLDRLGKLPGDIRVEGKSFSFNFPIVTCLILSIVLSVIFYLIGRFR